MIVRGSSYAALHREAARLLARLSAESEVVVLAPSHGAAADFVRSSADKGYLGVHTLTLPHLAAALATRQVSTRRLTPMSQLSQEALVARVVYDLRSRDQLEYFAPVADRPGFIRALSRTLSELRLDEVDLTALAATGAPGADLSRLAAAFARELEAQSLADLPQLFRMAIETARHGRHHLLGLPIILLDVPVRSRLAAHLIAALHQKGPVHAFVLASDEESARHLTPALGSETLTVETETAHALDRLRRHLFEPGAPEGTLDASLDYFSAAGEGLECVEIARRIRDLAAQGIPFDRVAVLLRAPERYQPLLEEAFRRAGIPAYFARGTSRPDASGRALLALLACVRDGLSASRFAEYLSLAQIPDLDTAGAPVRVATAWSASEDEILSAFQSAAGAAVALDPEADAGPHLSTPAAWERMLVDAAVIGGRDRWQRRLLGLEFEIRQQLTQLDDDDERRRDSRERRLKQLRNLRQFALPLIGHLDALPKQASWSIWIDRLTELAETAIRKPDSIVALLRELRPMSQIGPVTLAEVYRVLEERLRFIRRDSADRRYGRVFAGSPDDARARHFAVVFLPGLAEGIFPRRVSEDPLLLDDYRATLHLHQSEQLVERERLLLHTAAAAAGDRLVVSYPRMDVAQSRPRVPSFYAIEVLKAAEGRLPNLREFEKRAASATPSRLGWPYPEKSEDAIDDTEYDLAALLRGERKRGAGRYLIEESPVLARSLRTRWQRYHAAWSDKDGLVDPAKATLDRLTAHSLLTRSYSPTALQSFSHCPYRFLLQAVYRLSPRDEAEAIEHLDPMTRGSIFHEVQHHVILELQQRAMLPLDALALAPVFDVIDHVLNSVARDQQEKLAPAIARVWTSEIEEIRTDLRGWIRHMATIGSDWLPIQPEFDFKDVQLFHGFQVHGRIDLVERHRTSEALRITDHKTGKPPEKMPGYLGGGAVLQPVLYAAAAEQKLGQPVERGRLFFCTQRGGFKEVEIRMNETALDRLRLFLNTVNHAVESGFLPAAPNKDACLQCDMRPVCGPYEERRLRSKPVDRLEPLRVVRQL